MALTMIYKYNIRFPFWAWHRVKNHAHGSWITRSTILHKLNLSWYIYHFISCIFSPSVTQWIQSSNYLYLCLPSPYSHARTFIVHWFCVSLYSNLSLGLYFTTLLVKTMIFYICEPHKKKVTKTCILYKFDLTSIIRLCYETKENRGFQDPWDTCYHTCSRVNFLNCMENEELYCPKNSCIITSSKYSHITSYP